MAVRPASRRFPRLLHCDKPCGMADPPTPQPLTQALATALATLAGEALSPAGQQALALVQQALAGAAAPLERLTDRQRQVAALLAQGVSNKGIAVVLGIRPSTAKLHVASVLKALDVTTREAVAGRLDGAGSSKPAAELIGEAGAAGA